MGCFYCIKITITIIVILLIICLFEFGLFQFFDWILEKCIQLNNPSKFLFPLLGCILLNYLLIRALAIQCLYQWQFPIQIFNIYSESRRSANNLRSCFKRLKYSLLTLGDPSGVLIKGEIENIKSSFSIIDSLKSSYEDCMRKFGKISSYQNEFYQYLIKLYSQMEISGFREYFNKFEIVKMNSRIKCDWQQNKHNILDSNKKLEMSKMILTINFILEIFDNYILDNQFFFSWKYFKTVLFNDTFGDLNYLKSEFYKKFKEYKIEEFNEGNINYCIISDKEIEKENRKLFFFCGPNGGPYEIISEKKIKFYLDRGIDVLLWNYRGYGFSKGRASFRKCKNDVLKVFDSGITKHQYNMIAVGGYSIGGVAATHLAVNRRIDVLISDRNFASISKIAYCFSFGKILKFLSYFFLINNNNTIDNFINPFNPNCFKIILCSSSDEIIKSNSSIKTNSIIKIMNSCVKIRNSEIVNAEDILDLIFSKEQKESFIKSFIFVCDYYFSKKKNNKIFEDFESFGEEKELLIEDNINNNDNQIIDRHLFNFFEPFYNVCSDDINDLSTKNYSYRKKSIFVRDFFTNFILWGVQYKRFLNPKKQKNNQKDLAFYNENCKQILISCERELYAIKSSSIVKNELINNIILLDDLMSIFIQKLDELEVINSNKIENNKEINHFVENQLSHSSSYLSNEFEDVHDNYSQFCKDFNEKKKKLKLIKISCGHNGLMNDDEYNQYEIYLTESKFID